jgi:mono/diheme cytochrome c family protein
VVPIAPSPDPGVSESGSLNRVLAKGAELYAANCQLCHGDREGKGTTPGAPPNNESGHTWHHPDAQLKETIFNGKPGFGLMPPFKDKLTEQEVDAILEYVKTWWTEDQRRRQADISQRYQQALDKQENGS